MTLLSELRNREAWETFYRDKTSNNLLTKKEISELDSFLAEERYLNIDPFSFGYPQKMTISRMGFGKKRTVYAYSPDEMWVLKLLAFLLYRYDDKISPSCYAFRKNRTAKNAFDSILAIENLNEKYVVKSDIHDYFNSMDTQLLMEKVRQVIDDDEDTVRFMETLLMQDKCYYNGELIQEKRGGMAGVPLASFWANIYLADIDQYFEENKIPYYRYSDDVLFFASSQTEADSYLDKFKEMLVNKNLTLNEEKTEIVPPHGQWSFLGFSYQGGTIDIAPAAVQKVKDRIRRKAHKLYLNGKRKHYPYDKTAKSMIRSFDNRFYDLTGNNRFTWTRYYFPLINTSQGLHKIDEYMLEYLRYLYTGSHTKKNYEISYAHLKKLGYTPLVAEYYSWKKENKYLDEINR